MLLVNYLNHIEINFSLLILLAKTSYNVDMLRKHDKST